MSKIEPADSVLLHQLAAEHEQGASYYEEGDPRADECRVRAARLEALASGLARNEEKRIAYVVTQGSYSDYSVLAVYSTREAADEYVERCITSINETTGKHQDHPSVEEFPLDAPAERMGSFEVRINNDGSVKSSWFTPDGDPTRQPVATDWSRYQGTPDVFGTGYGRTLEHARRSIEELRRVTITEGP